VIKPIAMQRIVKYLADGLTEETIATLGQIDPAQLSVIGRTSTMTYKGTRKSLAAIGSELWVDYLLEGSNRGEGGVSRITSKLIRGRDQAQVWSASYDRQPTSMLGLQQELSTAIAEQTRFRLSPERLNALSRRQTRNADGYDLYLRGRMFWNQLTPSTTRRAVEYCAHSMLGHLLSQSGLHDEASAVMRRAGELELLSSLHYAMSSQVAFQARDPILWRCHRLGVSHAPGGK
jgi:TolB-like protein